MGKVLSINVVSFAWLESSELWNPGWLAFEAGFLQTNVVAHRASQLHVAAVLTSGFRSGESVLTLHDVLLCVLVSID